VVFKYLFYLPILLFLACGSEVQPQKLSERTQRHSEDQSPRYVDDLDDSKDDGAPNRPEQPEETNTPEPDINDPTLDPEENAPEENEEEVVDPVEPQDPEEFEPTYKVLLFTGDNSIWAFDNAREELSGMFQNAGIESARIRQLTMMSSLINQGMTKTSDQNINAAMSDLNVQTNEICMVHMTSHGSTSGFYLKGQSSLTPSRLDQILTRYCGSQPTVVMVSACYSGIFTDSSAMQKPNRLILTAARKDRTSFGCSPENEFTYWDGCLIDYLQESASWQDLHNSVLQCIERKESAGGFRRSYPQIFVGSGAASIPYPF